MSLPQLIVFDLDYTMWPFFIDTHVTPPFHLNEKNAVIDMRGNKIPYYPEVPQVLDEVASLGIEMGVASRTSEIEGANQLIELFGWKKYLKYIEIYPSTKVTHFKSLEKKTGKKMSDMLFFDDEERNKRDLKPHNVTTILVENGMDLSELKRGLQAYSDRFDSHAKEGSDDASVLTKLEIRDQGRRIAKSNIQLRTAKH